MTGCQQLSVCDGGACPARTRLVGPISVGSSGSNRTLERLSPALVDDGPSSTVVIAATEEGR